MNCKKNLSPLWLQYVLKPTFTKQHIAGLDKQGKLYRAYDGTTYLPGIVGLNNIKANDYANVVLQVSTAARVEDIWTLSQTLDIFSEVWYCLLHRLFLTFRLCETTSWRRKTTRASAGHQVTLWCSWCRGLVSLCVNFGTRETSRPTCRPTRCCRLWCFAARRTSKLQSKVMLCQKLLY